MVVGAKLAKITGIQEEASEVDGKGGMIGGRWEVDEGEKGGGSGRWGVSEADGRASTKARTWGGAFQWRREVVFGMELSKIRSALGLVRLRWRVSSQSATGMTSAVDEHSHLTQQWLWVIQPIELREAG